VIPAGRIKNRRDHLVPLAPAAVDQGDSGVQSIRTGVVNVTPATTSCSSHGSRVDQERRNELAWFALEVVE
jgi:hypothetical protein